MPESYPANEFVLHFIWKHRLFEQRRLLTTHGGKLLIYHPGFHNRDAGPDFSQGKIQLDSMVWVGHIEIHLRSSDWKAHGHHHDPHYDGVILHVVWEDNEPVKRTDGSGIPTIELQHYVRPSTLLRQQEFVMSPETIPCRTHVHKVDSLVRLDMISRCGIERLEKRGQQIRRIYQQNEGDWDRTFWVFMARHFGFGINNEAFESLAKSIPRSTFLRCSTERQLESLLLGLCGFLHNPRDSYTAQLKSTYDFLKKKYGLENLMLPLKLLRTRPHNFPTFRLAQLAAIFNGEGQLFTRSILGRVTTIQTIFSREAPGYWKSHFRPGIPTKPHSVLLSPDSCRLLIINCISPMVFFYGMENNLENRLKEAVEYQENIKAENNRKTRIWESLGFSAENALESQGLIELLDHYCAEKLCLECKIGTHIFRNS